MTRTIILFGFTIGLICQTATLSAQTLPATNAAQSEGSATSRPSEAEPDEMTARLHPEDIPNELRPFQLELPRADLFGNWGGLRSDLEHFGITPSLNLEVDT